MVMSNETSTKNQLLLTKAKLWFNEVIVINHVKNIEKLAKPSHFNINPFLVSYLAKLLEGSVTPSSIAKALVYPRVLSTSITTSFGQNLQTFISDVLGELYGAQGSVVQGMDIEFVDALDGRKKYAQVKAGPNTINKDDVETIHGHFRTIRHLARTNKLTIETNDLVIGVLYGTEKALSGHYKALRDRHNYPLYVGNDFWHRLTGDAEFFDKLVVAMAEGLDELNKSSLLDDVIAQLAQTPEIQALAGQNQAEVP
jgi:hypothetical protein